MGRKAPYNRGREQRRQTQQFEAVHNAVKTLSSLQQSKALAKITLHDKLQVSYGSHFYQDPCILAVAWGTRSGIDMLKRASPDEIKFSHISSLLEFTAQL